MIRSIKHIIVAILITSFIIACNNKDTSCASVPPESEAAEIAAFCNAQGLSYIVDTNGIYYQVADQGSGIRPDADAVITVTYMASTLDGNIVEDKMTTPVTNTLNQFIEGWRIALPYIQKGGRIKMVVPSSLAYGCTGISNLIAPNSPLYYDIVLIDVK